MVADDDDAGRTRFLEVRPDRRHHSAALGQSGSRSARPHPNDAGNMGHGRYHPTPSANAQGAEIQKDIGGVAALLS
ncbi:hypothetical protein SDC9_170580 [bioreactor metagenome]|uniref:Uncharacterized protein n=1 Tax=bioreactor metagenome TaxID=1076179 RepID=A0A645GB39_9ZZZZ